METHIETKERQDAPYKDIFQFPPIQHSNDIKEEQSNKCQLDAYANEESCIFEEYESNFFVSPSCSKKKYFPDIHLLAKVSRNSHPSPSCSSRPEDRHCMTMTIARQAFYREEPLEINFDPREFMVE